MSRNWFQQRERGSPFLVRSILWIALHLGRTPARLLLHPITLYFLLAAPKARRASADFLRHALGRDASLLEIAQHIHTFSATILDRVFLLADRHSVFDIHLHGEDRLLNQLSNGQGCLLLGSHLGSFEVMRTMGANEQTPCIKTLMYPDHNQMITRLLDSLNPQIANSVIPLGGIDSLLKVNEALEQGCAVALLGDRVAESDKVVNCNFLGQAAQFPAGPLLMAATLHVPVVLIFGLYRGGNRYDIHFELLSDNIQLDRNNRDAAITKWVQRYVERLEHYARKAPYNWFNFYDFWNTHD